MEGKNEKRKERKKVGRNKGRNKRTHTQDDITVARRTAPPPLCLTVVPSIIHRMAPKSHTGPLRGRGWWFLRFVPGLQPADLLPDQLLTGRLLLLQLLQPVLQLVDVSLCTTTTRAQSGQNNRNLVRVCVCGQQVEDGGHLSGR